jgi:molecular chaperone GrpE
VREIDRSEDSELFKGVTLIQAKFRDALKAKGLEEIEVSPGDTFDPEVHEAVTQIPAPNKKLEGKIIDVIEKGYKLGERIIRHPKVVVGK